MQCGTKSQSPAAKKLKKLPTVNPATTHNDMKPKPLKFGLRLEEWALLIIYG